MPNRRRQTRPADAYAWPAVLGLAVLIRLGVLVALPEFFAWRVTLPVAVLHTACDLATMAVVRALAGEATGTPGLGTLAAALFALHPHLVFETLSTRHTALVLVVLHAVFWLVV